MATDFAKKRRSGSSTKRRSSARKKTASRSTKHQGGGWRWYGAGVITGVFLSFLVYLGSLPPTVDPGQEQAVAQQAKVEAEPPKPRFDFYKMLPQQTIEVEPESQPSANISAPPAPSGQRYLLQAGSFRQLEDAQRRRAELLLLGLEPDIKDSTGDNGRWYRVYVGPFDSRSDMARARSLTANQNIDTLVLKRDIAD